MKISGLQKLSLVDFDGHMAATIFVSGCNFACPFCHNSRLVNGQEEIIPRSEVIEYLEKRKNMLDAVCISGGEPTLYKDLPDLVREIKSMGYLIKLDTNGTNPAMIRELYQENLIDYIAMDIKNSYEKYSLTAGKCVDLDNIKKSIKYIMSCGIDYEFRTTLIREFHNFEDIKDIAKIIKSAPKYFLQKFEDSGECIESGLNPIPKDEVLEYQKYLEKYIKNVSLRGY